MSYPGFPIEQRVLKSAHTAQVEAFLIDASVDRLNVVLDILGPVLIFSWIRLLSLFQIVLFINNDLI